MRAIGRVRLLVLAASLASCSPTQEKPAVDLLVPPDLGPVELCKPKGLPPGMITREEQQRRDAERKQQRDEQYQRDVDEWKRQRTGTQQAAEAACDAAIGKLEKGTPLDAKDPREKDLIHMQAHIDRLLLCRAVATNTPATCDAAGEQMRGKCRVRQALLRAAAATPPEPALADVFFTACSALPRKAPCAAIRDAIKGDPASCPARGAEAAALCAMFAFADPARCPKPPAGGAKPGDDASPGADCVPIATWMRKLKGGLAKMEAEGEPDDRMMAAAALGKADACNAARDAFRTDCVRALSSRAPVEPRQVTATDVLPTYAAPPGARPTVRDGGAR